jgi:response regulator NasT
MNERLRIAIADDEAFMRNYLCETLSLLGHEVICAASGGRELVEACRRTAPDLVITDIRMGDMDGLDAAAAIYRDAPVPIIVVSGYHGPDEIERAEQSHVAAYLVKPIKKADLGPTIAVVMSRFRELHTAQAKANS